MKNILVAEDSTEIREALTKLIDNRRSIIQLNAGLDLDRFRKEKIDLAIIEISGSVDRRYDLIQALLDLNQDVKILLVFDASLLNLAKPLLENSLSDYLLKPIDADKLRRKINLPLEVDKDIEFVNLMKKITTEMAHRIKNPLTTIKTFAYLLEERFDDPEFRGTFYRSCLKEVEGIDEIIERLISYSSLEKPAPAPADLNSIIKEAIYNFRSNQNFKDIRMITDFQADVPPALVDRVQMRLIIENIFSYISTDIVEGKDAWIRCLRSSLKCIDWIEIEISYPFRREGLVENDLFAVDLFLAQEAIRYLGGELDVRVADRGEKVISIRFPCCIGIEGIMRLDFNGSKVEVDGKVRPLISNHYDRRSGRFQIPFEERRILDRRRGGMSLSIPEKRQILGIFAHP